MLQVAVAAHLESLQTGRVVYGHHPAVVTQSSSEAVQLYFADIEAARQLVSDESASSALSWARRAQVPRWGRAGQGRVARGRRLARAVMCARAPRCVVLAVDQNAMRPAWPRKSECHR